MVSAILFDWGGTLDADGAHWLDRFYQIYDQIGLRQISKARIKEAFYWADSQADEDNAMRSSGLRSMMERHVRWQFQRLQITDPELENSAATAFIRPAERVLHRNRHILEKLHYAGLKLGIVSNFYGNIETLCREFGYLDLLGTILDSAVSGLRKPDPKVFRLALERLQVADPAGALFVGDSFERDIVPARAAGMRTAWLISAPSVPARAPEPDLVLHSLEELPGLLTTLRAGDAV